MKCPLSYTACGVVISRWGVYSAVKLLSSCFSFRCSLKLFVCQSVRSPCLCRP